MSVNTEKLIASLASDLEEVRCASHPLKKAMPWFVFAVFYVAFVVAVFGMRADFLDQIRNPTYVFEMLLVVLMSMSASLCSLWLCVPDMRGQKWMLAVPLSLFSVLVTWIVVRLTLSLDHMPEIVWHKCITEAIIFGLVPAVTLVLLASRGKTTQPKMMSFMNIIAIGGLGYIGLRLTCVSEDIGHILSFHFAPYIFIGALIALAGVKIFRW